MSVTRMFFLFITIGLLHSPAWDSGSRKTRNYPPWRRNRQKCHRFPTSVSDIITWPTLPPTGQRWKPTTRSLPDTKMWDCVIVCWIIPILIIATQMTKSVAQDRIGFAFIFNLESYKLQKYFSFVKYAATDFHNIPFCIMHRETLNDALQNVHLRAVLVFSALNSIWKYWILLQVWEERDVPPTKSQRRRHWSGQSPPWPTNELPTSWWTNFKFQSDSSSRSATSWVVFASCIAGGELHQWWPHATIRHLKWKLKTIGFLLRAKPAADMKDLLFKLSFKELFLEKLSEGGRKGLCPFYLSYFKTENVPFYSKFTFFSEHNFHKCLIGPSSASLIPQ